MGDLPLVAVQPFRLTAAAGTPSEDSILYVWTRVAAATAPIDAHVRRPGGDE